LASAARPAGRLARRGDDQRGGDVHAEAGAPGNLGETYAERATQAAETAASTARQRIEAAPPRLAGSGRRSERRGIDVSRSGVKLLGPPRGREHRHPKELEALRRPVRATAQGAVLTIELEVSAPHPGQPAADALLDEDGERNDDRVAAYRAAILQRFEASPEAQAEPEAHWAAMLVDYATSYFGKTAEALIPAELDEIVFELIPRKVSVEPEAAPAIVAGLRAFLVFLQREHPGHAKRCLAVLDDEASQRLARLLADPSSFGPAKSFVMSGRAAGFDMSSQAGLGAWAAHMQKNNLRLPMSRPTPAAPRRDASANQRAARQVKKTKRKAQRAARKRSR
jgi:hypothetical protein